MLPLVLRQNRGISLFSCDSSSSLSETPITYDVQETGGVPVVVEPQSAQRSLPFRNPPTSRASAGELSAKRETYEASAADLNFHFILSSPAASRGGVGFQTATSTLPTTTRPLPPRVPACIGENAVTLISGTIPAPAVEPRRSHWASSSRPQVLGFGLKRPDLRRRLPGIATRPN